MLNKLRKSNNKDLSDASTSALWKIQGGFVPSAPPPENPEETPPLSNKDLSDTSASARGIQGRMVPSAPPVNSEEAPPPSYETVMSNTQSSQNIKIMLSYQRESQRLVLKIKERLENAGFHVCKGMGKPNLFSYLMLYPGVGKMLTCKVFKNTLHVVGRRIAESAYLILYNTVISMIVTEKHPINLNAFIVYLNQKNVQY